MLVKNIPPQPPHFYIVQGIPYTRKRLIFQVLIIKTKNKVFKSLENEFKKIPLQLQLQLHLRSLAENPQQSVLPTEEKK